MKVLRIDDRLIHGQVIVGWVKKLGFANLILLYEDMPEDIVELYKNMLQGEIPFDAVCLKTNEIPDRQSAVYVIENIYTAFKYIDKLANIKFDLLNIGGLRTKSGKFRVLDFVYMNQEDIDNLKVLAKTLKSKTNAQELPESEDFSILKILLDRR